MVDRQFNAPLNKLFQGNGVSSSAIEAPRKNQSFVFSIFAILFVIGCYVNIPYEGVPMVSAFPFAMIMVFVFRKRLFSLEFIAPIGISLVVFLFSILSPDISSYFDVRLLAFFQYVYSIVIGVALFWTVTSFEKNQIAHFCKVALVVLIFGGSIEITTGLSSVMDALSQSLYFQGDYIDIVNNRDVGIGLGYRRPKFFTSETSYFAMAYCVLVCVYAWLSDGRQRYVYAFIFGLVGLVLARSPIPVISLVFISLLSVFERTGNHRDEIFTKLVIGAIVAIPSIIIGYELLSFLFETRLQTIDSGDDYSMIYRTYGSLSAALAALEENPLFGVGIGSIDLAFAPLTNTYLDLGIPASAVFYEWRFQVQNLPAALAIYLGIVGSVFYLASIRIYVRFLVGQLRWPIVFLFLVLCATEAAFYSPRFNVYFFVFLAIGRLATIRAKK